MDHRGAFYARWIGVRILSSHLPFCVSVGLAVAPKTKSVGQPRVWPLIFWPLGDRIRPSLDSALRRRTGFDTTIAAADLGVLSDLAGHAHLSCPVPLPLELRS